MALLFGGGDTSVGGAAHNHKPAPSLGKKHLHPTNEYHSWDYLKGSGPAAPSARHPDDKPRFKPGWKVRTRMLRMRQREGDALPPTRRRLGLSETKTDACAALLCSAAR